MTSTNPASNQSLKHPNPVKVLGLLFLLRLANTALVQTFFQPDEYFQALEPAWQAAFGPGSGAYITWEWKHQLRSSLHPALFAAIYKLADYVASFLSLSGSSASALLIWGPKVAQALFAALGDWYTWRLARKLYGEGSPAPTASLWMTALNPWQWYCSTRTFSNSLETTLTIAALNYWPWELFQPLEAVKENPKGQRSTLLRVNSLRLSLVLAATAVLLRPTNLLIWIPILLFTLRPALLSAKSTNPSTGNIIVLIREVVLCGLLTLALSVVSDRLYFGFWAFPPYKWLYFNISHSLAVFYGRNPWHYYFLQGLPLLCTTLLPFVLAGLYDPDPSASRGLQVLPWAVYNTIGALSLISHKEVRFTYPLLPLLHIIGAPKVAQFFLSAPEPRSKEKQTTTSSSQRIKNRGYLAAGLLINALLASYLSLAHQRAPISVLSFLRAEFARTHPQAATTHPHQPGTAAMEEPLFVMFLTPCHTTPWRSHLIYPSLTARALTCEPPLHTAPNSPERVSYRDEADRFYDDPVGFLGGELWPIGSAAGVEGEKGAAGIPRLIVGFEGVEPWLRDFFAGEGKELGVELEKVWEGWNGFFNEDWRRSGKLVVWDTGLYR